jgi:dTDP-4-amino-4,6-dideoxygalactose transaminase
MAELGPPEGRCPAAERAAGEILSLPIFPGIAEEQQHRVADMLASVLT